jgi:hypothetical protein
MYYGDTVLNAEAFFLMRKWQAKLNGGEEPEHALPREEMMDLICESGGKVGIKFDQIKAWREMKCIPRLKPEQLRKISDVLEKPETLPILF